MQSSLKVSAGTVINVDSNGYVLTANVHEGGDEKYSAGWDPRIEYIAEDSNTFKRFTMYKPVTTSQDRTN